MNTKMIGAVVFMAVIVGAIFNFAPAAVEPMKVGQQAKVFQLPDLSGTMQVLPQGEVVLLNFWATWCPPCRKEVPSMVKLDAKLQGQGLRIVAVSEDRKSGVVKEFVREKGMKFTVLHDADSAVARLYNVFRYPETYIIDKNGVVRKHLTGAVDWLEPSFVAYIEKLLAEPVNTAQQ